jgi:hypothetical protein
MVQGSLLYVGFILFYSQDQDWTNVYDGVHGYVFCCEHTTPCVFLLVWLNTG